MATRQLPDAELLRKLLRYDPETGKLYWLPRSQDDFVDHPTNTSFRHYVANAPC